MKIGIFDSGYGGLSVLHQAQKRLPDVEFLYYADEDHVPYGEKTKEEIIGYVDEIVRFFLSKKVDAIVIACNTATSAAAVEMRKKYELPIIGMEPAVKRAMDLYGNQKVLTVATPITVKGKKMHDLIERVDQEHLTDLVALPGLVRFAEEGTFDEEIVVPYLKKALEGCPLEEYSSIVLGCTHFNYFKDSFRRVLPKSMKFVDGIEGTINRLAECLELQTDLPGKGKEAVYYASMRQTVDERERKRLKNYMDRLELMLGME